MSVVGHEQFKRTPDPDVDALFVRRALELIKQYDGAIELHYVYGDPDLSIATAVGFSPLVNPLSGVRYGQEDFLPYWRSLTNHGSAFELIVKLGEPGHLIDLFVEDNDAINPTLRAMCQQFSEPATGDDNSAETAAQ
jgi:hypothetical protein